jgi:arylsulfatase A-like enzyme
MPIDKVYNRGITNIFSNGRNDQDNTFPYFNKALDTFLSNVKNGKKTFTFLHTYYVHSPYLIEARAKLYTKDNLDNIPLSLKETIGRPFTLEEYKKILDSAAIKEDIGAWHLVSQNFYDKLKNAKSLKEAEKIFKNEADKDFWYTYYTTYRYFDDIDENDKQQVEYIKALYDQKIHEFDEWVGNKLVPFLENPLIKNNTMVIITSDHGEEFMEHGQLSHKTLYDPNLKIPLIVYIPGITNKTVASSVQSVDIVPTILDAIGISNDSFSFQGQSLIDLIQKNTKTDRLLIADGYKNATKSIIKDNWKLFLTKDDNGKYIPYELYNIELDPNELNNILANNTSIVNKILNENEEYERAQIKF